MKQVIRKMIRLMVVDDADAVADGCVGGVAAAVDGVRQGWLT